MSPFDQVEYFATRERQQREFARRATRPDIIDFHVRLTEHYHRLVEEARQLAPSGGGGLP